MTVEDPATPSKKTPSFGPAHIAVPVIIAFIALVVSVFWMRLTGGETTADRIAVLPNGPTLSESLRPGWGEPLWRPGGAAETRISSQARSFRLGVLSIDLATALRARERLAATQVLERIGEELSAGSFGNRAAAAQASFAALHQSLDSGESIPDASSTAHRADRWLSSHLETDGWDAGLFLEQGRIILKSGKTPPRSWHRQLDTYIASEAISPQITTHLQALKTSKVRSAKIQTIEYLLDQVGENRTSWLRESGSPGGGRI